MTFSLKRPLITASLSDEDILSLECKHLAPADIIELRIDLFDNTSLPYICSIVKTARYKFSMPILATIRDTKEGGSKQFFSRLTVYRAIAELISLIDIEINSNSQEIADTKALCKTAGLKLLLSYHNFEGMPSVPEIRAIIAKAFDMQADIVKIALKCKHIDEVHELYRLCLEYKDKDAIFIAMGDVAKASRIVCPLCGSLMTYGYVNKPTAEGQLSIEEIYQVFKLLKVRD